MVLNPYLFKKKKKKKRARGFLFFSGTVDTGR